MLSRPVCTWRAVSRRNVAEPKDLLKFQEMIVGIDLSTFCVKRNIGKNTDVPGCPDGWSRGGDRGTLVLTAQREVKPLKPTWAPG